MAVTPKCAYLRLEGDFHPPWRQALIVTEPKKRGRQILVVRAADKEIENKTDQLTFFSCEGMSFILVEGTAEKLRSQVSCRYQPPSTGSRCQEAFRQGQPGCGRRVSAVCNRFRSGRPATASESKGGFNQLRIQSFCGKWRQRGRRGFEATEASWKEQARQGYSFRRHRRGQAKSKEPLQSFEQCQGKEGRRDIGRGCLAPEESRFRVSRTEHLRPECFGPNADPKGVERKRGKEEKQETRSPWTTVAAQRTRRRQATKR